MNAVVYSLWILALLSALPGIMHFLWHRDKVGKIRKLIFLILFLSVLGEIGMARADMFGLSHIMIYCGWHMLEFLMISYIFLEIFSLFNHPFALLLGFASGGLLILQLSLPPPEAVAFSGYFVSTCLILSSLVIYYLILKNEPVDDITVYPLFWLNTAIFLFSTVETLTTAFDESIIFNKTTANENNYFYPIGLVFRILRNLMLFYTLYLIGRGHSVSIRRQ